MKFEPIPCHESLRPYVRNYWLLTAQCIAPGTQRIFSNGAMSMHFFINKDGHYDEETRPYRCSLNRHDLSVVGVRTEVGDFELFGVEFVPFGTRAFWNLADYPQSHITPADMGDSEFIELERKVLAASSTDERRRLLDDFLCRRLEEKVAQGINMQRMEDVFDGIAPEDTPGDMASNACLGPKQFNRVFSEYVGMNPKSYQRLLRFHKAMMKMREGKDALKDIAYDCGYTDLAHMTKDIQQLCGHNPSELLAMGDKLTEVFQGVFSQLMKKKIEVDNMI